MCMASMSMGNAPAVWAVSSTNSSPWSRQNAPTSAAGSSVPHTLLAWSITTARVSGRSSNKHGSDNVISNGSVIAVADGQCMMIVDQGRIVEVCAVPGEFTYDMSTEPSLFTGELKESVRAVIDSMTARFTFGGEAPKDQRVYTSTPRN